MGSLNRWINAAVLAKGSASFTEATIVGSQVTESKTGVVEWVKGTPTFTVTTAPGPYVGQLKAMAGGTSTISWSVDAQGLPHRFVVVDAWPKQGSYREVTTYSRWGSAVTITLPPSPIDMSRA